MKIRLRRSTTAITLVIAGATGGAGHSDPLQAALDYTTTMSKTVQHEQQESQAERAEASAARAPVASRSDDRTPTAGLPPLLSLIRDHESSGDYSAFNPTGCDGYGCGGAYQLHALYASEWARRAGYPGQPANAAQWPPSVQDATALDLFLSTNPDGYHWCHWTDYC